MDELKTLFEIAKYILIAISIIGAFVFTYCVCVISSWRDEDDYISDTVNSSDSSIHKTINRHR